MVVRLAVICVLFLSVVSCKHTDCISSRQNKILSEYEYNSPEYQAELYKLIQEQPDVDYYFEMQEEIAGQNYLIVSAYGNAFCGKLCLVIHEDDVEQVTSRYEKDYQGAQLIGLRYTKRKTDLGEALVYQSLEYLVD